MRPLRPKPSWYDSREWYAQAQIMVSRAQLAQARDSMSMALTFNLQSDEKDN